MTFRVLLLIALIVAVVGEAHAQGNGPGFHASVIFGGGCNAAQNQTVSSPTAPATVGPDAAPCVSGTAIAAAEAAATTLRASSQSAHECCGTSSGATGRARIQIENVVIAGPAAPSIPVSLNFRMRGTLASHPNLGQAGVFLFVRLSGFNTLMQSTSAIDMSSTGILNQTGVFAPLSLGFPASAIDQAFVTPVTNAAPNQPLRLDVELMAYSDMAGVGTTESDFFTGQSGVALPLGVPVFNLPPGYTVDIPELNIVNNYVALPATLNGDIFIVGSNASEVSLPGVTEVTGNIIINDNAAAIIIDLGELDTADGNVIINDNTAATTIDLGELDTADGNVIINDNTAATTIDLGELDTADGNVIINDNTAATTIDLASLDTANIVDVSGNTSATGIDLGSLTTANTVGVSGNTAATGIDLSQLDTVGVTVSVANNTAASGIDLGSLTTVNTVDVSGNTSATGIDLASLTTANGSITVTNNGPCTAVTLGSLATVVGDLTVESCGTGTFTPGPAAADGNMTLTTSGYTLVTGTTAAGTTTVSNATTDALMTVQLPAGSFVAPVSFSIARLDPVTLAPELGLAAGGGTASIDPVAAYQFTFGVPTLNEDATLSFDIYVAGLDTATANDLLAALATGTATLATRGDVEGSAYQAFPLCGDGGAPGADGCVLVQLLDAAGQPTTDTPAIVRFSNVVGHFSTWAVAIVTAGGGDTTPPAIGDIGNIVLAATSAAGATATFVEPAATDDSGVVNVGCLPASGSSLPIGRTTVVCTATDGAGNTAHTEFTVTVVCCGVSLTVNPASARPGEIVWLTGSIHNFSQVTQRVVVTIELTSPLKTTVGSIPLRLPPGMNQSFRLPFMVPPRAPIGVYHLVLTTVTTEGTIQASTTLDVVRLR